VLHNPIVLAERKTLMFNTLKRLELAGDRRINFSVSRHGDINFAKSPVVTKPYSVSGQLE
jgi:hypothetical protein